jgi:DNA-binding response OmpR family regulator
MGGAGRFAASESRGAGRFHPRGRTLPVCMKVREMPKILVVDDEVGIRELLSEILRDEGHDVLLAENATEARTAREAGRPDMVLLDIWMPDTDGITLLKEWSGNGQLNMPVVMMSGHATIDTAVEATRIGALDFLEKPIGMQKLLAAVKKALERGARHGSGGLSLGAFARPGPLRDLKRRLDQVLAKSPLLLLRSAPGGIVELVARSAQVAGKSWIDLAHETNPLSTEMLQLATGGVLWCEELARLSRLQQKNLLFAAERLDRYGLRLVAATTHSSAELLALGWDEGGLARLFETGLGVPGLAELKDEVPDIAAPPADPVDGKRRSAAAAVFQRRAECAAPACLERRLRANSRARSSRWRWRAWARKSARTRRCSCWRRRGSRAWRRRASRRKSSSCRCARRAKPSSACTSNTTWPRTAAT